MKNKYPLKYKTNVKYEDGLLIMEKDGSEVVLVPEQYSKTLIKKIHDELCHVGVRKLLHYIAGMFYWPNMQQTIQECLRICEFCAKRKINQKRTKEILIPRESSEFLEQIVIDIAYMEKVLTKRYLVVIIDRFSKIVSLTATSSQDEKTILSVILNCWVYRFGKPKNMLSDRGRSFESAYMRKNLGRLGIKQEFSSPYQHQSNGLAERTIRTVRDLIATTLAKGAEEKNWYEILPKIEFTMNITKQSTTGYSPFEILFGRKVNLHSTLNQKTEPRQQIVDTAIENTKQADERMRNLDIDRRGIRFFEVGEEVLVRKDPHKRTKDGIQYEGPYKILKFLTAHQVELQCENSIKQRRIEWLKKWHKS
jgi:transposase InsO family protein